MKRTITLLFLFSLMIRPAFSQYDKNSVFEILKKQYGNIKTITLNFTSPENNLFSGSLKAASGMKYIIQMKNRSVICDGKTIWNYSSDEKKVTISTLDTKKNSFFIDNFFFSFLNNYVPDELSKEQDSKKGISYILSLKAIDPSKSVGKISKIRLWLNSKINNISKIEMDDGQKKDIWKISGLKLNTNIPDKAFTFKPGKGVEVIDLR